MGWSRNRKSPYQLDEVTVIGGSTNNDSFTNYYFGSVFPYGGGGGSSYGGGFPSSSTGGGGGGGHSSYGGEEVPQTDCFFKCLEHISNKYGYHYNSSYYANQYYSIYGGREMGVDPYYMDSFSSKYFSRSYLNLDSPNAMMNFVANENNSLIVIYNTGMGSDGVFEQHAVVVERIFGETLLCYDPQAQKRYVIEKEKITNYLAVTGNCH